MIGIKQRVFHPLVNVTLDDLVAQDHFYRHLERTLDLSFVRELVRERYAANGRPSIDPVVFFKLQLVLFFEGMRSERQLERVGADRLSVRWYLGYDLLEPLPDHSSLTRMRERYGLHIFRRFFERVVEWCQGEGLVWGKELYADATLVEANADRDKMLPRFAVQAHHKRLFGDEEAAGAATMLRLVVRRPHKLRHLPHLNHLHHHLSWDRRYRHSVQRHLSSRTNSATTGTPTMASPTAPFSAAATSE